MVTQLKSGAREASASAAGPAGRPGGDIKFSGFALVLEKPKRIRFQDHMIPYHGQDEVQSLPWGVYGSTSMTTATYLANEAARKSGKRVMVVSAHVSLPNFSASTQKLPCSIQEADGFLHMSRLGAALRDELHGQFLLYLKSFCSQNKLLKMADLEWAQLLCEEPAHLRAFMLQYLPSIRVMVHPVRQQLSQGNSRMQVLHVGSFKLDKSVWAEVANSPDIEVDLSA